jgi:hypothetical protein
LSEFVVSWRLLGSQINTAALTPYNSGHIMTAHMYKIILTVKVLACAFPLLTAAGARADSLHEWNEKACQVLFAAKTPSGTEESPHLENSSDFDRLRRGINNAHGL